MLVLYEKINDLLHLFSLCFPPCAFSAECSSTAAECSPHLALINSPPGIRPWHLPPVRTKAFKVYRRSFPKNTIIPICAKLYSVAELQVATSSFSKDNLLGQGSLGSVYRAEVPDGEVKNLNCCVSNQ